MLKRQAPLYPSASTFITQSFVSSHLLKQFLPTLTDKEFPIAPILRTGDLDGDGLTDLIVASASVSTDTVRYFKNVGSKQMFTLGKTELDPFCNISNEMWKRSAPFLVDFRR